MPLENGSRLGPFEITAPLGAGGMGEVYRARDTRLNRDVAIKILPDVFAADADRLARFKREAQVLAALNHPHIAAIYGLEEAGGVQALVLELVEGPTLADRVAEGPLPLDEALAIARQIAEALEAAHQQGVIHRDLKPANIKVREDGSVKVLDFGLAKLAESAGGGQPAAGGAHLSMSPTITTPAATGVGVIMGTAAYMAPEQARGKTVDTRADVWAFGCVLYEMLTGTRAFAGEDATETIAAVVKSEPDWSALPPDISPTLRIYLRRCLQKNPRDRIHGIGDVRLALEGAFDVIPTPAESTSPAAAASGAPFRWPLAGATALVLVALSIAATWFFTPTPRERPVPIRRFAVMTAPALLGIANTNRDIAITPDGTRLVYFASQGATRRLFVRPLDALEGTAIREAAQFFEPFISPDGRWVGFNDESVYTLKKMPLTGGPPITIAPVGREILGATWGPDDTIVFATTQTGTGLWRVPATGGTPTVLTTPDKQRGEVSHCWPQFLPGGKAVLYTIRAAGDQGNDFQVAVLNLETGERKILVPGGSNPQYSAAGYLVYGIENTVRAVRFDPVRLQVAGDSVPVLDGVMMKQSGGADFTVSADGTVAYIAGATANRRRLVWVNRDGTRQPINAPPRQYQALRLSPDGARVALDIRDQQSDIWIWDFTRETLTRLTTDPGLDGAPVWTPDGRRIVFYSSRTALNFNLFMQPADGTGAVERLTDSPNGQRATAFLPDGMRLVFREDTKDTGWDIRVLTLNGQRSTLPVIQTKFNESNGEVSPDGRWLAYQSNESGQFEVYVRPFPDVESGRWQISTAGGTQPAWGAGGRELFYVATEQLIAVPIRAASTFTAGNPQIVVDGRFYTNPNVARGYDVARDGKRFLMIEPPSTGTEANTDRMIVVLNWVEELKRLLPNP